MMTGNIADWVWIAAVGLFPMTCLAVLAVLYSFSLRKRLAQALIAEDALTQQASLRDSETSLCEVRLAESRASHDKLMREFHHRVKNSLQIIQSYLALSRRQRPTPHNSYLAEAEAKVHVIATAYRLALNDGSMSSILIRSFVQDIVENAEAILCGSTRKISASIEPNAHLVLDRAIPLGLGIIEAITGALGAPGVMHVGVRIRQKNVDELTLIVSIDDLFADVTLPLRLMVGLQSQLSARADACAEDEVLNWHFST